MIPALANFVPMVKFCVNILRGYPKKPAISKPWDLALVFQAISAS